jgi:hypothetical protein
MHRNPLCIIIPCHRVVAADRRLGGFGGQTDPAHEHLRIKRWLLAMEGAIDSVDDTRIPERDGTMSLFEQGP